MAIEQLKPMNRCAEGPFATDSSNGRLRKSEISATDTPLVHRSTYVPVTYLEKSVDAICISLERRQRARRSAMKTRIKFMNDAIAKLASSIGYHSGLEEKKRDEILKEAKLMLKQLDSECKKGLGKEIKIVSYGDDYKANISEIVKASFPTRNSYEVFENLQLEGMSELAAKLPIAPWFDHPDRRGIGLIMLATIIGETGNLFYYANPAKVWRRIFGYPYEKNGERHMPSTWRSMKGLNASEWTELGYSPSRHATMYNLKNNIVRQNGPGPYRQRYDEARDVAAKLHPDWKNGHLHNHGQLCAAKRLVRDLWVEWQHYH